MEKTTFVKFVLIPSSNIIVLKKKWKYEIAVEHNILFNEVLMYKCKTTRELYIVSESSNPKGVVIMLIIYKVVSPNQKVIQTKEG